MVGAVPRRLSVCGRVLMCCCVLVVGIRSWIINIYYYTNIYTKKYCKLVLKLLRHVSLSIHHLQRVSSSFSFYRAPGS
jgi:hypothetical protein